MVSLLSLSLENLLVQHSPLIVENSFLVNPAFFPPLSILMKNCLQFPNWALTEFGMFYGY